MTDQLSVTPFEEEVLQVIVHMDNNAAPLLAFSIHRHGQHLFGQGWGGPATDTTSVIAATFPAINLALGRLRAKGLLYRREWLSKYSDGQTTGLWKLTPLGYNLLGLQPSTS